MLWGWGSIVLLVAIQAYLLKVRGASSLIAGYSWHMWKQEAKNHWVWGDNLLNLNSPVKQNVQPTFWWGGSLGHPGLILAKLCPNFTHTDEMRRDIRLVRADAHNYSSAAAPWCLSWIASSTCTRNIWLKFLKTLFVFSPYTCLKKCDFQKI